MNSCWYSFKNWVDRDSSRNREYTRFISSTSTSVAWNQNLTINEQVPGMQWKMYGKIVERNKLRFFIHVARLTGMSKEEEL